MTTGIFYQEIVAREDAEITVLGIPFDGTVSNRPGTRFGPRAIRDATLGSEDYSPWCGRDIADFSIHDAGDLELPVGDTTACLDVIRERYSALTTGGIPCIALGGEHLVSVPMIEVLAERHPGTLHVVQFDAHADLRTDYLGVSYSHATVMHHVHKMVGGEHTASIGIRSGTAGEWRILGEHPAVFGGASKRPLASFGDWAERTLAGKPVYLTIDCDVFDPGVFPGTGTPEPGGIDFPAFIACLDALPSCSIIGADIVELSPDYDTSGVSQALAATVLRELILRTGACNG